MKKIHHCCRNWCANRWVKKASKQLKLEKAQEQDLHRFSQKLLEDRQHLSSIKTESREQLIALLKEPTLDRDKAAQVMQNHLASIANTGDQMINSFGDFFDSLSREQHQQLQKLLQRHDCRQRCCN